ncbi:MAG: 2OG-Fe(II) oxygenase [Gemmatimonadota bacterium]
MSANRSLSQHLQSAISRLDVHALRARFLEQGELLVQEEFLPETVLKAILEELPGLRGAVHRNYVPRVKKGGSVSRHQLDRLAPIIPDLYRVPAFREFLEQLTGETLLDCPDGDPHAYALYYYTEPGDHIGWHYDVSYYRGKRYTLLLGLVDRSGCRLECELHRADRKRASRFLSLALAPGMLVFFNGDTVWHRVTPLGEGEERVCLSLEFVTDQRMTLWHRFVSDMKDSIAYFGFRQVFRRRPPPS